MKPDFLVCGAPKSATTWLYACLQEHPEIFIPGTKEIHYFSQEFHKGDDWYEQHFLNSSDNEIKGEVSPSYLAAPEVAERIYEYNPDVKLIFLLRNPINRAYSHYCTDMRVKSESAKVFENGIRRDLVPNSKLVQAGMYHENIKRFLTFFPRNKIKILFFEDIKKDHKKVLEDAYTFLNVDDSFQPSKADKKVNQKKNLPKYPKLDKALRSYWRKASRSVFIKNTLGKLVRLGFFDFYMLRLNKGEQCPELPADVRQRLQDFYKDDISSLSGLVGRELSMWK